MLAVGNLMELALRSVEKQIALSAKPDGTITIQHNTNRAINFAMFELHRLRKAVDDRREK